METDDELQTVLADTLGYDELDLVTEILGHRGDLVNSITKPSRTHQSDGLVGRLQNKEQRAEALRQQDYEHKNSTLAASTQRGEAVYPHVYKAHEAGNTLSATGRKYALPLGSRREEHEASHD